MQCMGKKAIAVLLGFLCCIGVAFSEELSVANLPPSLNTIKAKAFFRNSSLEKVIVPEGTVRIESKAFADSLVEEIELPLSLEYIAEDAFSECYYLTISAPEGSYAYNWAVEKGFISDIEVTPSEDFDYTLENGECTINAYLGEGLEVVIPETIDSCPVTCIGDGAFAEMYDLRSVVMPDTVTQMGSGVFSSCVRLEFADISKNISIIESDTFADCYCLRHVNLPKGLKKIGEYAFIECDALTRVVFPQDLVSIGEAAFSSCDNLRSIRIPSGVADIQKWAFDGCEKLFEIVVDTSNEVYTSEDGVLFTKDMKTLICYPAGKEKERYHVPDGVATIGDSAFWGSNNLLSIVLPNSVVRIEDYAFDFGSYQYVYIPESVEYIGECEEYSFTIYGVSGTAAETYALENGIEFCTDSIPEKYFTPVEEFMYEISDGECVIQAYEGYRKCVFIPEMIEETPVTGIAENAFEENGDIVEVNIPSSVTKIEENAFFYCGGLQRIKVDDRNQTYASRNGALFSKDQQSLLFCPMNMVADYSDILQDVVYICNGAMRSCSARNITIPDSVIYIGDYAFSDSYIVKNLVIPDSVCEIGVGAFYGCEELCSVVLPNGISRIEDYTFEYCVNLKQIQIPESVTFIGPEAFAMCGLTSVMIPENVEEISPEAFICNLDFTGFMVDQDNMHYSAIDGVLFSKDQKTLMIYPDSKVADEYTVPEGTISIADKAFMNCCIKEITILDGVVSIGNGAFSWSEDLELVHLPSTVKTICDDAFDESEFVAIDAPEGSYAYQWAKEHDYLVKKALIESAHPYANNTDKTWSYTHPENVYQLKVTFSPKTEFENKYDALTVIDSEGVETIYTGTELAGKTLVLPGKSFKLRLKTDVETQMYGFAVVEIIGEKALIESKHPYDSDSDITWTYTHPQSAYALKVRFANETYFEEGYDYLYITDGNGYETGYTGSELAGKTIALRGRKFILKLVSDESYQEYGFIINEIQTMSQEEYESFT